MAAPDFPFHPCIGFLVAREASFEERKAPRDRWPGAPEAVRTVSPARQKATEEGGQKTKSGGVSLDEAERQRRRAEHAPSVLQDRT